MSVSLRDVAKAAKVSVGTVSNVLNRPEVVAPTTLLRVQNTIKELGFVAMVLREISALEEDAL